MDERVLLNSKVFDEPKQAKDDNHVRRFKGRSAPFPGFTNVRICIDTDGVAWLYSALPRISFFDETKVLFADTKLAVTILNIHRKPERYSDATKAEILYKTKDLRDNDDRISSVLQKLRKHCSTAISKHRKRRKPNYSRKSAVNNQGSC